MWYKLEYKHYVITLKKLYYLYSEYKHNILCKTVYCRLRHLAEYILHVLVVYPIHIKSSGQFVTFEMEFVYLFLPAGMAWNQRWWHTSCSEALTYSLPVALLLGFMLGFCYTHPRGLCGIGLRDCFCSCFTTSMNTILQLTQSANWQQESTSFSLTWSYVLNFDFKSPWVDPVAIQNFLFYFF